MEKSNKNKGKMSIVITCIALILLLVMLGGLCFGYYKKQTLNIENPVVTMEVEKYGTIKIELYPDIAPETVKNFINLANNGYYDGLTFHRIIKDFMIQGGYSESSVTLGKLYGNDNEEQYCIKGEFMANGYDKNTLNLTEGVIAMARADYTKQYSPTLVEESYNSANSQFFIMTTDDYTSLSGYYAGFGKVIEGMDVVKEIASVKVKAAESEDGKENENAEVSTPVKEVKITSVKVETNGVKYDYPETVEPFNYMNWLYSMYGISY